MDTERSRGPGAVGGDCTPGLLSPWSPGPCQAWKPQIDSRPPGTSCQRWPADLEPAQKVGWSQRTSPRGGRGGLTTGVSPWKRGTRAPLGVLAPTVPAPDPAPDRPQLASPTAPAGDCAPPPATLGPETSHTGLVPAPRSPRLATCSPAPTPTGHGGHGTHSVLCAHSWAGDQGFPQCCRDHPASRPPDPEEAQVTSQSQTRWCLKYTAKSFSWFKSSSFTCLKKKTI